jgi:hypothetical protein
MAGEVSGHLRTGGMAARGGHGEGCYFHQLSRAGRYPVHSWEAEVPRKCDIGGCMTVSGIFQSGYGYDDHDYWYKKYYRHFDHYYSKRYKKHDDDC